MSSFFICPRCGNKDINAIGYLNGKPYCRKCIAYRDAPLDDDDQTRVPLAELALDYELSDEQKQLSHRLIELITTKHDVLIHAVTGAGKTEIVYALFKMMLSDGKRVGFAIPRRDVVIELSNRFASAFPYVKVVAIYGGHHQDLSGDIIVLTTHQLYRYQDFFDVLVIDECDAFPFKGDEVLDAFARRAIRGSLVMMSATPDADLVRRYSSKGKAILRLWTRYHRHPLPLPQIVIRYSIFKYEYLLTIIKRFFNEEKPLLIFVPTIAMGVRLYQFVRLFISFGGLAHSKHEHRYQTVADFRTGRLKYLIATSILERGITLKNLQVIVFDAHHILYDSATLLQMAGRVGRKADAPTGSVMFLAKRKTKAMKEAIEEISDANRHL